MAGKSSNKQLIQKWIYGASEKDLDIAKLEEKLDELEEKQRQEANYNGKRRQSPYVTVFEDAVIVVTKMEEELLSDQERNVLEKFSFLSYNARYCLCRLLRRTPNRWYPVSGMQKYIPEVGEEGLPKAILELCQSSESMVKQRDPSPAIKEEPETRPETVAEQGSSTHSVKEEDNEIIDLTLYSDKEEKEDPVPCNVPLANYTDFSATRPVTDLEKEMRDLLIRNLNHADFDFFCEDESKMSLPDILWCLKVEQLKSLMKEMRCKLKTGHSKKEDMIRSLLYASLSQTVLHFPSAPSRNSKGKARDNGLRQTQLQFTSQSGPRKKTSQCDILRTMALKRLGKCLRVNYDFYKLVRRIDIISFRQTDHPISLLLPALLTKFKKRDYTLYDCVRSKIWSSREELLEYERALEMAYLLEEFSASLENKTSRATNTPIASSNRGVSTAITVGSPSKNPKAVQFRDTTGCDDPESVFDIQERKEERLKRHLEEWIIPTWREHLSAYNSKEADKPPGLQRFEAGHIYTRLVTKASQSIYGRLKEYESELRVLELLLQQRRWRRGKRAALYERRAIVLGHITRLQDSKEKKKELLWKTLEGLKEALLDDDTSIVLRPSLVKRLMKLEKTLKLPDQQRSKCEGQLQEARTEVIQAFKFDPGLRFDPLGRVIETENSPEISLRSFLVANKNHASMSKVEAASKNSGKSLWKGRDADPVNVETRALEFYEDKGYKGFHSETSILTTIFGLLCWDIIFASIPGAFETKYQLAPLDMFEDSFYHARKDLILPRLEAIRTDGWRDIYHKHNNKYRPKKTRCIGVNWDLCSQEDLLDILECIGGESLSSICQFFCEDFKSRMSGGPDLFVWNAEKRTCKFVEVKGPGDIARENQKFWFDSLLRANVDVELCKVVDVNAPEPPTKKRKRRESSASAAQKKKLARAGSVSDEEDYDQLDVDGENDDPIPPRDSRRGKRRRTAEPRNEIDGDTHLPITMNSKSLSQSPLRPAMNIVVEVIITPEKPKRIPTVVPS